MPQTQNSYDSGESFNQVSIPNVNAIYMYAHAYSNSAGGPNNDHRQAYIYQIQAWGVESQYTDIGLSIEKNGVDQRIGVLNNTGSNVPNGNNLRVYKNGTTYGIPFLNTQTATLLPSFNGLGYQWGCVVPLSAATAGTIQLFTNSGSLMATDNGSGGWASQPAYSVTGSIGGYSSGCNGGYGPGLILVNSSPQQSSPPYILYRDPQASNVKVAKGGVGSGFYLPNAATSLSVNLCQLPTTTHVFSGGGGGTNASFDGDFVNNPYGTNSPNEIDVYSEHYFANSYTLTNINFRVEMLYYAYGDHQDTGNFNAEIYYSTNGGGNWTEWWGTSG